jgi:hypothetical protein
MGQGSGVAFILDPASCNGNANCRCAQVGGGRVCSSLTGYDSCSSRTLTTSSSCVPHHAGARATVDRGRRVQVRAAAARQRAGRPQRLHICIWANRQVPGFLRDSCCPRRTLNFLHDAPAAARPTQWRGWKEAPASTCPARTSC